MNPSSASRTFNAANQRSNTGFAYDGNGNPTTYGGKTNVYDSENRMTSYDLGNGRWLTRDPIGVAVGINVYGYC